MSWLQMSLRLLTRLIGLFLTVLLGGLVCTTWLRKVYFALHSQVRLWFKLAAGHREPWTRDGGIPQGCPLSMFFSCCFVYALV